MNNYIKKNTKKQGKQTTEKLLKQQGFNTVEELIHTTKNNILGILGINDINISTLGQAEEVVKKGIKTKIIKATLSYDEKCCEHCNCVDKIVKNGFRTTTVKIGRLINGLPVELKLKKQIFKCNSCLKTFSARTSLVPKYRNISNIITSRIAIELSEIQSLQKIAISFGVSSNTVQRVLKELAKTTKTIRTLPQHISFDELKTTKDVSGAMSFIYANANTHEIIDIVMDRKLPNLKQYFISIPRKQRLKVKTITIDMYSPYITLIKELFPKTKIVIDKFHIIQHINREFNKLRIKVMNEIKNTNRKLYTKYKKNWKLLLKDYDSLTDDVIYTRNEILIQRELVMDLVRKDSRLQQAYWIMQDIRSSLKQGNYDMFVDTISTKETLPKGIRKVLNTFNKYKKEIKHTMMYPQYTNGHLEGINNKLKLIKRVAFGYRKFENFKARSLIIFRVLSQPKAPKDSKIKRKGKTA